MAGVLGAAPAMAGPVVREASGANAAAIQAAVDQFRADLGAQQRRGGGHPAGGRREINWDGGGAARRTLDPVPMTRFCRPRRVILYARVRASRSAASRYPNSAS